MGRFLFALSGPTVWLLFFSALYAIETMACTPAVGLVGTPYGKAAGGAAIATTLLLAAVAASQFFAWRRERDSIAGIGLLLTGLSVAASAWTALPLWVMRSCG
jgi:hypothetical protein